MRRWPLGIQVGAVAIVLAVATGTLWWAGGSVADRAGRREAAARDVEQASVELAERAAPGLALLPTWPDTLSPETWLALDAWLADQAAGALEATPGVEGGFYVPSDDQYLGISVSRTGEPRQGSRGSDPPPADFDLVDKQVRAAIESETPRSAVIDGPGGVRAVRAAPVWVNNRKVAATWALARIDVGPSLSHSLDRYRLAANLSLAGIALALALTVNLARTIRRQADERDALQGELRRSERLAALGKLVAGVAHEVRNPLAGIRSTAQLWQRGIPPDAESVGDIILEVDRLDGLVTRLLQFSRPDALNLRLDDLNAVVAEAARLARPAAETQGVSIEVDLDPDLPAVPLSAPALLQVLRNLTTNALQVMPDGGSLRLTTRAGGAGQVRAEVADTGPGLSPETLNHIFEPFFTTRSEGTGLGLAIAREITLAHRGEIRAENRSPGPGAVFSLTLPTDAAVINSTTP